MILVAVTSESPHPYRYRALANLPQSGNAEGSNPRADSGTDELYSVMDEGTRAVRAPGSGGMRYLC